MALLCNSSKAPSTAAWLGAGESSKTRGVTPRSSGSRWAQCAGMLGRPCFIRALGSEHCFTHLAHCCPTDGWIFIYYLSNKQGDFWSFIPFERHTPFWFVYVTLFAERISWMKLKSNRVLIILSITKAVCLVLHWCVFCISLLLVLYHAAVCPILYCCHFCNSLLSVLYLTTACPVTMASEFWCIPPNICNNKTGNQHLYLKQQ